MSIEDLNRNTNNTNIKSIMEQLKITLSIEDRDMVIYIDNKKVDKEDLQSAKSSLAVSRFVI